MLVFYYQTVVFMHIPEKIDPRTTRSTLFVRGNDPAQELWEGPRTGLDAAPEMFAVDEARDVEVLARHLANLLPLFSHVYLDSPKQVTSRRRSPQQNPSDPTLFNIDTAMSKVPSSKVQSLCREVHHLRKLKSAAEIDLMRRAADISANAHARACHTPLLPDPSTDLMV